MGDITMRQVILEARIHESTVIRNDVGNACCESADLRVKSDQVLVPPRRMRAAAPRWFAAIPVVKCRLDVPRSGHASRVAQRHRGQFPATWISKDELRGWRQSRRTEEQGECGGW